MFSWAEELLADTDLVAGEGEAARIVSYIRQDESPHVEYLRTALSEMRDRTFIGQSDQLIRGTEVITALWDQGLADSTGVRRENNLRMAQRELEAALDGHVRRDEILEGHAQRATPGPDGKIAE